MTYLEWNSRIGGHFFNDAAAGQRITLCVTPETLAAISGMVETQAVEDFVQAVKDGPSWTQIAGCLRLGSKARNCLYPDPHWDQRGSRNNEKRDLSDHIHWEKFLPDSNVPPYLTYLVCFVLAWTERPADCNGNDYYGPLNDLLGLEDDERLGTNDFGTTYRFNNNEISVIDLWKDLENWGFKKDTGVCYLPPGLIDNARYVDIPKYFGLLKASDMKHLPRLFAQLEENGELDAGQVPGPAAMVGVICGSRLSPDILSNTCLSNLGKALESKDAPMVDAYGRLLCAKYRDFDGFFQEDPDTASQTPPRCRVRLLRIMDSNGNLKVACRLRKEDAWERLPLEEGKTYRFEATGAGGNQYDARWIANSPWFGLMDIAGINPPAELGVRCCELLLSAKLVKRDIVVMRNWGLPYHLQGGFLEVDELESGRDYVFLVPGNRAPVFDGFTFSGLQSRVPPGFSCWKTRIPDCSGNWPAKLPPLVEDKPSQPTIRLEGFRLEPRSSNFPLQFPLCVHSSDATLEVFIKSSTPGNLGAKLSPDNGDRLLVADAEGDVVLALRNLITNVEIPDSDKTIKLIKLGGRPPCDCVHELIPRLRLAALPYPQARLHLQGGTLAPLVTPDPATYLASDPPVLRVEVKEIPSGDVELLINGQNPGTVSDSTMSRQLKDNVGTFRLECRWKDIPLCQSTIVLKPDPQLEVRGLSTNPELPKEFLENVCATVLVKGDVDTKLNVHYTVMHKGSHVTKGDLKTPHNGLITSVREAGLKPDCTYELRFDVANKQVETRWFKVRPQRGYNPPPRSRTQGLNPMADAFDNLPLVRSNSKGRA